MIWRTQLSGLSISIKRSQQIAHWFVMNGKLFAHLVFYLSVLGIVREVLPFPLVVLVVVTLFRTVGVNDLSVSLRSNTIIFVAECGDGSLVPGGFGVLHQHGEVISFELFFRRLATG